MEKNTKIAITALAVIIGVIIVAGIGISLFDNSTTQEIEVGNLTFIIPKDYQVTDERVSQGNYEMTVLLYMLFLEKDDYDLTIWVFNGTMNNTIMNDSNSVPKTINGIDGYFIQGPKGVTFSYELNGKTISYLTNGSDYETIFSQIIVKN